MANQNVTQLTQQTGSADPTSLFYAVTGGIADSGLPLSVFVHNLGLTGTPTSPTAVVGTNTTQIASTAFVQSQLTSSLAPYALLASPTFTGTVTIPTVVVSGGTIDGTAIGSTTPSTGSFTTLAASSTVSGAGFTARFATPGPIGNTTASTGAFTTLSATSTVSGAGFSTYLASPPAIGSTAANTGAFTTLSASGTVSGTGFSTYLASPPAIGGIAAAAGSFTNLSSSGTVSGTGFSNYLASPPAIGGTTAAAGSFTNLSSSGTVSGTGFSNYLLSPPAIGTTTPAAGKFTTLTATSTITPSTTSGIVGTTLGDNANAGSVGEYITATGTSVSLVASTGTNVTSVSLTAGDWEVQGSVIYRGAGSTVLVSLGYGFNIVSATQPADPFQGFIGSVTFTAGNVYGTVVPSQRISVSSTTTVFLVVTANFTTSTATATGIIRARRVR